jgi:hypothetical protein
MRQMTPHPDCGGLGVERQPDALALELLRGADATASVDENVAVAKGPGGKHRQRDEWTVAPSHQADEFGRGKLRDIEFMAANHAIENLSS